VVFEFKSAIREEATIYDAYVQLTTRYRRDIPELFKFHAFCVISDGANSKCGSFFAPYEFWYAWRCAESMKRPSPPAPLPGGEGSYISWELHFCWINKTGAGTSPKANSS